jgi:hypothetical protein
MTRDIERGTRGIESLISYVALQHRAHHDRGGAGADHPGVKFDAGSPGSRRRRWCCTSASRSRITEWRTKFRKRCQRARLGGAHRAVDSLLNYETVKYFNNEEFEARRYDASLDRYRKLAHQGADHAVAC